MKDTSSYFINMSESLGKAFKDMQGQKISS